MNNTVIKTQTDLGERVKCHPDMLPWCMMQGDIVVLQDGHILAEHPGDRAVQNCRIIMLNKGLKPLEVRAASLSFIKALLDESLIPNEYFAPPSELVSDQQQRLRQLIFEALKAKCSDIHLEVREAKTQIRFRRHGELYYHTEWSGTLGRQVASVAFNHETDHAISHFSPLRPQHGSMTLTIEEKPVRLRLASMPAQGGFDVVMRVLALGDEPIPPLSSLGYSASQLQCLHEMTMMPYGAVLIAGPTGSGKTTTVASCLSTIPHTRKIYTIEEPVEKILKQVTQIPVNTDHSPLAFAEMGRAALRLDPDVIVLGEMRDEQTAAVMLRASLTGHLVFSTLHTNSIFSIVTRLVDLGLSRTLLADQQVLGGLICQRLVPKLCHHCKIPFVRGTEYARHRQKWNAFFQENIYSIFTRGQTCSMCLSTGLSGRTVIAEMIRLTNEDRSFILSGDHLNWEKTLRERDWMSYREIGMQLILSGHCDPLDIESVIGHDKFS